MIFSYMLSGRRRVDNNDKQFDIGRPSERFEEVDVSTDLQPVSRVAGNMIGRKEGGHNGWELGAVLDEPISL